MIVADLAAEGMSTRAIAPVVGVSDRHVRRIANEVGHEVPPAEPRTVTGRDGKTYTTSPAEEDTTEEQHRHATPVTTVHGGVALPDASGLRPKDR